MLRIAQLGLLGCPKVATYGVGVPIVTLRFAAALLCLAMFADGLLSVDASNGELTVKSPDID